MLKNFFVTMPNDLQFAYSTSYDLSLVCISIFIAIFSSCCVFEMIERLSKITPRRFWLPTCSIILGVGVWSMHFLGMIALKIDCLISYDKTITTFSILPSIISAAIALNIIADKKANTIKLIFAGAILALGVGMMHFLGMSAIELDGILRYEPKMLILSIAVPTAITMLVLFSKSILEKFFHIKTLFLASIISGTLLGVAISTMHYVTMNAAYFLHLHPNGDETVIVATDAEHFAIVVVCVSVMLVLSGLGLTFLGVKVSHVNNHLNAILGRTSQGFVVIDNDGIITECNQAMANLIGTTKRNLIGQFYCFLVTTGSCGAMKGDYQKQIQLQKNDGSMLDCLVYGNEVKDNDGNTLYSFALFSDISLRIKIEKELLAREQQFQSLLQSTPDPMVIVCENGLIKMVNRKAEEFFGYSEKELFKQPVEILMPERFRENHVDLRGQFMQEAKNRDMSANLELVALNRAGDEICIELSLGVIQHAEPVLVAATLRDITKRKRLESENRKYEIRLFDILNLSPIAVRISINHGKEVIFYNRAYAELIKNFDALGENPENFYTRPEEYAQILQELDRDETILNRQMQLNIPEVQECWVLASYMKIQYQEEDAILGWFYDITERIDSQRRLAAQLETQKAIQETLRLANEEQQAIFNSASSGIVLTKDRAIVRCNRKLEQDFGYEAGELVGKSTRIWYADEEQFNQVGNLIYDERNASHSIEQQYMRKDGSLFWARVRIQAIDENDFSKGVVGIINDITCEYEATKVLLEAKELAENATKMKSDFLANMSHEIRTPMNAIIGLSHLVMKTEMSDKQRDYLRKIQSSSQHLLGILNDILDFSKIEAGKLIIENIEFNLENVLSNISQLIHEKATEKGLELVFDVAPDVPNHLIGDPLRLGQVLINFATNAIKFTEKGEIDVIIRKIDETEKDVLIKLTVKDTGIGLSEEQTQKLFQSFQQADTSTTRKYGGTGLGLAICKNLAQMMDGEVGVESQLGEGSQFWFTAKLGKSSQTHHGLVPHPDLRGKRVLVVDDNENARTVIATLLDSMAFQVCEAETGQKAIQMVQKALFDMQPFEAIFLDWQMPNMDGIEVAKALQNMKLSPIPKLLLVTAYGREEVLQNAVSSGFDEVLLKPVNASMLLDSMARVFGADITQANFLETHFVEIQDLSAIIGAKILVVEDNDINQEIAKELLESEGFEVEIAENGQIALEKITQNHYDILLMDMQMPVMDGVSATIEIRKLSQFNDLPIIAMTANAMLQDKELCFNAGMNAHISKPIEPNDLWSALVKWIKPRQTQNNVKIEKKIPAEAVVIPINIDGLDTELGLRRVLNKREFYVSILKSFVNTQANATEQIQIALDANDSLTAQRIAHTLKGLLGNIGALALQENAEKIEHAIQKNVLRDEIEIELSQLVPKLNDLIDALKKQLFFEKAENAIGQKIDLTELKKVVEKLAKLFADSDADAIEYLATQSDLLNAAFPKEFKVLQIKIDNFDFPDALELLKQAAMQHQISL